MNANPNPRAEADDGFCLSHAHCSSLRSSFTRGPLSAQIATWGYASTVDSTTGANRSAPVLRVGFPKRKEFFAWVSRRVPRARVASHSRASYCSSGWEFRLLCRYSNRLPYSTMRYCVLFCGLAAFCSILALSQARFIFGLSRQTPS